MHAHKFWSFSLLCLLAACSSLPTTRHVPYTLTIDDPLRVRFQGKGAGAGMMLSSTMGPMGVAIGVAIDEGIAKDIQAVMDKAGCNLGALVDQSFEQSAAQRGWSANKENPDAQGMALLRVQRIGFQSTPGDQDPAHAEIDMLMRFEGVDYTLRYPLANKAPDSIPLNNLKSDGGAACQALRDALRNVFDAWHPAP